MRIVCPKCVAQYEVDESAIPETGREVQCANCGNIWFQDYIEMLPTADGVDVPAEEDRGVFDDLEGKSEASFYSDRSAGPVADDTSDDDDTDYEDDIDQDFDDEDDAPVTNIPAPPVNEDVLDVLRSEAAFSSARDQLDAAAADALDGDGEALKAALDDAPLEPELEAEPEPDSDDLSAFWDAHTEEESEEDFEPEYDEPEFDTAALSAALDMGDATDEDDDDDFNDADDGTRHAYRADGATATDIEDNIEDALEDVADDVEEEIDKAEADLAAALNGLSVDPADDTVEIADEPIEDAMDDVADDINVPDIEEDIAAAVDTDRKADPSRRPKGDRKAMLPDVEELDASLRSESEEPRRRNREMMNAHEEEIAKAGKGGFRRAFIWTLFIVALLIALYVLRPQLVAALPPAAMVLDPYAAAIDSIRALINGILG